LDNRREADWLDSFLARLAEQPAASVWNAGPASAKPPQPRADVTEAVLRDVMVALRNKAAAAKHSSRHYAAKTTAAMH
jgi:hypothetical protein